MRSREAPEPPPVLLFDGVCNLCNGIVRFVIQRDPPPAQMRFAAIQSDAGQRVLKQHGLPADQLDTFVLIDGGRAYLRSTAALRTLRKIGLPWSLLYPLILVPRFLRDAVYDWIARHRYGWFGKRDACVVPTAEIESRFLR